MRTPCLRVLVCLAMFAWTGGVRAPDEDRHVTPQRKGQS